MWLGSKLAPMPIREQALLPLPPQDVLGFWRPRRGDPVRRDIAWSAAGKARHGHDGGRAEFGCEGDGVVQILRLTLAIGGVQLIAVGVERKQLESTRSDVVEQRLAPLRGSEELLQVDVRSRRPVAGVQLDALNAELGGGVEHVLEPQIGRRIGDQTDLHVRTSPARLKSTVSTNGDVGD